MSGTDTNETPEPLAAARAITAEPYATARDWKARGGRVVAYLCDNVPVELITAAGFLPCRLAGTPRAERDAFERLVATQYRTSDFGLTVAILEALASGECDFADYLVVPHNRKAVEAVHGQLVRLLAADPSVVAPQSWILDRSWLKGDASRTFNAARIDEFRNRLEAWRGSAIPEDALRRACEAHAESRRLLGELMSLRSASPPRLPGSDALAIIRAGELVPVEQYNALLRDILAASETFAELSGPRVFLAGSPFDHDGLYKVVESSGGVVVGEDHCWGMRRVELSLVDGDDPMPSIAARYHRLPGCSIACPLKQNVDACLRRARACSAEAVIFAVMKDDHTHVWTTPDELAAIREAGMEALHLGELPYRPGDEASDAIRHFLGNLP